MLKQPKKKSGSIFMQCRFDRDILS